MALAVGLVGRALASGSVNLALPGPWSSSLLGVCYLGLGATVVKSASSILLVFAEHRVGLRVGSALRSAVTRTLVARGLHDSAPRVLATIAVRIREVETATTDGVLTLSKAAAQLVPLALALIVLSPSVALGSVVVLIPFGVLLAAMRRRWRRASEHSQSLVEQLHAGTDELVKNLDVWRCYGKSRHVQELIRCAGERAGRAEARVQAMRAGLSGANEVLGALAVLGSVALAGELGLPMADGRLLACAAVFFMAYRPLRDFGDARASCARGAAALAALGPLNFRAIEPERGEAPVSEFAPAALVARNFGGSRSSVGTSFTLEPGEILCIVGPTGSGKTTLLRALLGLEVARGKLGYARRDLTEAPAGPGFRPFGWVPQDAPLVTGTLTDNVALFSDDRGHALAVLASVGGSELIQRVGDDIIGPGGRPLSGGESRQVAIARALCTGQPVLLLDEPTEGLDAVAAARVLEALQRVRKQRALLIVTHRSEVCAIADRVLRIGHSEPAEPQLGALALQN
jgi:ABC-type transport system involved in cytochrome bd biosynthesis fused ATPase/permease subunit